ncbi:MAG: hypothetical protein Q9P44_08690, partial [Anaerolineae bacterium]|nr:hypothetical protein [Anaerolineae bacterium]
METELIIGTIEYITFHNADNGYIILKLKPDEEYNAQNIDETVTVVGNATGALAVGDRAAFDGQWGEHPKYGAQFKFWGMKKLKAQPMASAAGNSHSGKAVLRAAIARITFYNIENSWGVIKVTPHEKDATTREAMSRDGTIAVVGVMPEMVEGESAEFRGKWVNNEQYGLQFKAEQVIPIAPKNEEGIINYLIYSVRGVGEVTATRIYNHFGDETIAILD